jgi:hypothetical protein
MLKVGRPAGILALPLAEDAAREMPKLLLEDALQLILGTTRTQPIGGRT